MDRQTWQIADYASSLAPEEIPETIRQAIERRLVDSLSCALAAYPTAPALAARKLARTATSGPPAHVLLSGEPTTPDLAAYAGTLMVRYWDWNDTYLHGGHPSDTIPAVLSVADATRSNGRDLLLALTIAYETFCALSDAPNMAGTSAGGRVAIATAAGCGRLFGLDLSGIGRAASLAAAGVATQGVRGHGALTIWRAGQSAQGARGGVQAAVAAQYGMAGPLEAFAMLGAEADLPTIGGRADKSHLKAYAAEYHAQAAIEAALAHRERVAADDVQSITVHTYAHAIRGIGSHAAMWEVPNVDTALHSMPYLVSVALLDGVVGPPQFSEERLAAPDLRRFIERTRVVEDTAITAVYPGIVGSRVEVATLGGQRIEEECVQPLGHAANPMSDAQIEAKLRASASGILSPGHADELIRCCRQLESCADLHWLFGTV